MDKRILELAIETLEKQKADIDTEIAQIRKQMTTPKPVGRPAKKAAVKPARKKSRFSAAERKRRGERMW